MKKLVLILLSCILVIIFIKPPAIAMLTPDQFIEPRTDMLDEDMNPGPFLNKEMVKLSYSVFKTGTKIEIVIKELEEYSETIKGYTEEKLAVSHLIRAIDTMKLTLISCFTHAIQLRFIGDKYFTSIYTTDKSIFEGHYFNVLNSSALAIMANSQFLTDKKLASKTMIVIVDVQDTFNSCIDYLDLLVK